MKHPKKDLKAVVCLVRRGGCGEVLANTDGEFLIIAGLKVNEEYATQQLTCTCGVKTIWKCDQEYLPTKNNRRRR